MKFSIYFARALLATADYTDRKAAKTAGKALVKASPDQSLGNLVVIQTDSSPEKTQAALERSGPKVAIDTEALKNMAPITATPEVKAEEVAAVVEAEPAVVATVAVEEVAAPAESHVVVDEAVTQARKYDDAAYTVVRPADPSFSDAPTLYLHAPEGADEGANAVICFVRAEVPYFETSYQPNGTFNDELVKTVFNLDEAVAHLTEQGCTLVQQSKELFQDTIA